MATLAIPSLAQQQHYKIAAKGTEQLIKLYDPLVRTVASDILATRESRSECGTVEEGNTVAFYCPEEQKIFVSNQTIEKIGNKYGQKGLPCLWLMNMHTQGNMLRRVSQERSYGPRWQMN